MVLIKQEYLTKMNDDKMINRTDERSQRSIINTTPGMSLFQKAMHPVYLGELVIIPADLTTNKVLMTVQYPIAGSGPSHFGNDLSLAFAESRRYSGTPYLMFKRVANFQEINKPVVGTLLIKFFRGISGQKPTAEYWKNPLVPMQEIDLQAIDEHTVIVPLPKWTLDYSTEPIFHDRLQGNNGRMTTSTSAVLDAHHSPRVIMQISASTTAVLQADVPVLVYNLFGGWKDLQLNIKGDFAVGFKGVPGYCLTPKTGNTQLVGNFGPGNLPETSKVIL